MATATGTVSGQGAASGVAEFTAAIQASAGIYAPVSYAISPAEQAAYTAPGLAFQVAVGFTPAFVPSVTNAVTGSGDKMHENMVWKPVVQFGSNRLAVVGESLKFYAGNCYAAAGNGIQNRYKRFSWGDGTPDAQLTGTGTGEDGGIAYHSYAAAGTYTVTLTVTDPVNGTNHGHRYVRVFDSWADADFGVVEIGGISGSLSQGGWSTTLTLAGYVGAASEGGIADGQGVVLRLLPQNSAVPLGAPEDMLFAGYVVGDTVSWDVARSRVQFKAETAGYWLRKMWTYEQHFYKSGEEGYGHFVANLTYPWVVNHMLAVHSNFAEYHDVMLWIAAWPNANVLKTITVGEGPLWNSLSEWSKNEYANVLVSRSGTLYVLPNVCMRGIEWWGSWMDPPALALDASNTVEIEVSEQPADQVGFVRVEATNPLTGATLKGKYPSAPASAGEWVTETILNDDQAMVDAFAERLYRWRNARYQVRASIGPFWTLDIGAIVPVSYTSRQ